MDQLTVYFECPFWVGVFEREDDGVLQTSRVVFGGEPKDYEVYAFVLKAYGSLSWSRPMVMAKGQTKKTNPKRMHREIQKSLKRKGVSTKAQENMRLEREVNKLERKRMTRIERDREKKSRFDKRQQKKKEKRKGH